MFSCHILEAYDLIITKRKDKDHILGLALRRERVTFLLWNKGDLKKILTRANLRLEGR